MQIIIISLSVFLIILCLSICLSFSSLAPWVPCWSKDLKRIFKIANLKRGEIFYDLGCGNGKTVLYANKNFKATAIGIELALPLFIVCKMRQLLNRDKNLTFKWKNLFKEYLSKADVIYFFGMPDSIKNKLKVKIEKEAHSGARIISYVFPVRGWMPELIDKPSEKDLTIYLYKIN
ncbi:MAG: hypothetical protein V1860_02310 [bacterium]